MAVRCTPEQFAAITRKIAKPAKYRNRKVLLDDGTKIDSRKEYRYWQHLLLLEKGGKIKLIERQVRFELVPKQQGEIRNERAAAYEADFRVTHADGRVEVIDCKSEITRKNPVYVLKRKLMKFIHGIEVVEV